MCVLCAGKGRCLTWCISLRRLTLGLLGEGQKENLKQEEEKEEEGVEEEEERKEVSPGERKSQDLRRSRCLKAVVLSWAW